MAGKNQEVPIIIKKINKVEGHHGGSWKVAFADFAVAMMAFFLLMWLLGSTSDEEKKEIAGYFQHPEDYVPIYRMPVNLSLIDAPKRVPMPENNAQLPVEREAENAKKLTAEKIESELAERIEQVEFKHLQDTVEGEMKSAPDLFPYKDQLQLSSTPEGLRLQLIDDMKNPMFEPGSGKLTEAAFKILVKLAPLLNRVPQSISITGHSEPLEQAPGKDASDWELSIARANDARKALEEGGIKPSKVLRVGGLGSRVLFEEHDPSSPKNRRVSIILLRNEKTEAVQAAFFDPQTPQS